MPRAAYNVGPVLESEVLLFPAGLDAIKNVVIDASSVSPDTANHDRRILPAGTLLKRVANVGPSSAEIPAGALAQYQKYNGSGLIAGVLALSVEFIDGLSNSDAPRGMFYHGCVFRASKIVDYSTYGLAAASTLSTCKFELV